MRQHQAALAIYLYLHKHLLRWIRQLIVRELLLGRHLLKAQFTEDPLTLQITLIHRPWFLALSTDSLLEHDHREP